MTEKEKEKDQAILKEAITRCRELTIENIRLRNELKQALLMRFSCEPYHIKERVKKK